MSRRDPIFGGPGGKPSSKKVTVREGPSAHKAATREEVYKYRVEQVREEYLQANGVVRLMLHVRASRETFLLTFGCNTDQGRARCPQGFILGKPTA